MIIHMESPWKLLVAVLFLCTLLLTVLLKDRGKGLDLDSTLIPHLKFELWEDELRFPGDERLLNCANYEHLVASSHYIASGWTKSVYASSIQESGSGNRNESRNLAVKIVNLEGKQISDCLMQSYSTLQMCYQQAAKKLIREIIVLKHLEHKNLIKLFGYCIPTDPYQLPDDSDEYRLAVMTSLGSKVTIIKLLQYDWEDRLMIVSQVSDLLQYLESSPLGKMKALDFRREQFVLDENNTDRILQLADVDDLTVDKDCANTRTICESLYAKLQLPSAKCRIKNCQDDHNSRMFLRDFVSLLKNGAPLSMKADIDLLLTDTTPPVKINEKMKELVKQFVTSPQDLDDRNNQSNGGTYFGHKIEITSINLAHSYEEHIGASVGSLSDYECFGTKLPDKCTVSVLDLHDARRLCDSQIVCKAFVWENNTSSSGNVWGCSHIT